MSSEKPLSIFEWGKIKKGEQNAQNEKGITLNNNAWEFLAKHAEQKNQYKYIRIIARDTLQIKGFVGVITTPDGTQIEILPKIQKDADTSRKILAKMLKAVNNLKLEKSTEANLKIEKQPLPELLITWFLQELNKIIIQGIRKDYIRISAKERFLKGSLQIARQINSPPHKQHIFHIEYDIFSPNRAENRLICSALTQVNKWSNNNDNQRLIRRFLLLFNEVPNSNNYKNDFARYSNSRDMNYYQKILPWLRLILNQQSPFALQDKNTGISFLIPMEKIFEKYVAICIRKQLSAKYKLKEQSPIKCLARLDGENVFQMKPDMTICENNKGEKNIAILDTKWKLINQNTDDKKRDISQSDMYQIFAYGKKYEVNKLALIYPKWQKFDKDFNYILDNDLELFILPFDLEDEQKSAFEIIKTTSPCQAKLPVNN